MGLGAGSLVSALDTPESNGVIFGAIGLRKVAYKAERKAIITGGCTGHRYEFGDGRSLGYVDARDVEGLLGLMTQDGGALFEAAQ